jgi:hypothetical protein
MRRVSLGVVAVLFCVGLAQADLSYFHFADPAGDQAGNIDVVGMDFTFDGATGAYAILLTADAANPFQGDFRININLFNPDTGTMADDPSFFSDVWNEYFGVSPTTTFTLSGTNPRLLSWEVGDRVAASSGPFGNPDGVTSFRCAIRALPSTDVVDYVAEGDSTVIAPLPGAVLLGMLGLGVAGWRLNRKTM